MRSRSERSSPQRLELWATGLPRKTTPKGLHDTCQGLSEFTLAPSRTGRPTARFVFHNQRSLQWALDRVHGRRPAQPHGEQLPRFTEVRLEREAPPVKKVRVEEGGMGEEEKRERTAEGEREMGPENHHPRDKERGDLINTIAIHRIP